MSSAGARLRAGLASGSPLVLPGAFDGLSAQLIVGAGFPGVYASGGAISRSVGFPDLGLLGLADVAGRVRELVAAAGGAPVVVDADTGFGNALNVIRTVQELERAGAAGIQLEDQVTPKRCGHYAGKAVIPVAEMVQKLRAALEHRLDPQTVIIARTDAIAVEGLEAAIVRARAYAEAGADLIFVDAPESKEQLASLPKLIPAPLMVNRSARGTRTPRMGVAELGELGYRLIIFPADLQAAAVGAMAGALEALRRDGHTDGYEPMVDAPTRDRLAGLPAWQERERRYATD